MKALPREILKHPDNDFVTVTEAAKRYETVGEFDAHNYVSWADVERDLSAWLSNGMQHEAIDNLYALEGEVLASRDEKLISDWRRLTTSDHFYYMCTKWFADGDVHKYFNPYDTPYEAFIAFNNVLHDVRLRLKNKEHGASDDARPKKRVAAKKKATKRPATKPEKKPASQKVAAKKKAKR